MSKIVIDPEDHVDEAQEDHGKSVKEVAENNRHQRGHGADAHVFCAQEIGRAGRDRLVGAIAALTVLLGHS